MAVTRGIAESNEEAHEAWNGVLYDRFAQFRHLVIGSLGRHGDAALELAPPREGERALDVGCGFGDTTRQIGELVGPAGSALGVDVAERFIETARREASEEGVANVEFLAADIQTTAFEREFDYAYSRFGTMFFAAPVPALRNVRAALVRGGRLCMVVWRRKLDNDWLHRAELAIEPFLERPTEYEEPTCGPGPFSMADADTVSHQLVSAGFEQIALHRCDIEVLVGADMEEAVALMTALGPAGEVIRLSGAKADQVRPQIEAAIAEALQPQVTDDGVVAPSSTWIITARSPGA